MRNILLHAELELVSKKPEQVQILRSDRGRGMSAQQIAWIEAYRQFDRPTDEQQGFGLGLAIAQQLAQIYGGQLIVDSILSQGTNVTISLPLVQQGINNTSVIQL